jgi:hypothetical protein
LANFCGESQTDYGTPQSVRLMRLQQRPLGQRDPSDPGIQPVKVFGLIKDGYKSDIMTEPCPMPRHSRRHFLRPAYSKMWQDHHQLPVSSVRIKGSIHWIPPPDDPFCY